MLERFHVEASASGSWRMATWLLLLAIVSGLSVLTLRESSELAAQQDPLPSVTGPAAAGAALESEPDAATPHTKYQSVEEAWRVGVAYYNSRNFAASQEPFEAALKLAPEDDVDFRLKVYGALRPSYRMLAEFEKMVDACDYILRHAPLEATRSLTRRELLSFVYERGKTDALIQRYENDLKRDPKDRTALYVLAEVYDRIKNDPRRAADLTQRLLALDDRQVPDVGTSARLAMQYVRQKKYREGAELYEQIAPLDAGLAAWHWKEAATAWLKAGDSDKALAAARKSAEVGPEKRSQQLLHFWHRHLGETFLATGEPKLAIEHLEKAIENTTIAGYVNDCQKLLEQAREQAGTANKSANQHVGCKGKLIAFEPNHPWFDNSNAGHDDGIAPLATFVLVAPAEYADRSVGILFKHAPDAPFAEPPGPSDIGDEFSFELPEQFLSAEFKTIDNTMVRRLLKTEP